MDIKSKYAAAISAITQRNKPDDSKGCVVLDIETDGNGSFSPPTQRPIEITWMIVSADRIPLKREQCFVSGVKKIGWSGCKYTCDFVNEKGETIENVFQKLEDDLKKCLAAKITCIVGHNIRFDVGSLLYQDIRLQTELKRSTPLLPSLRKMCTFCTMKNTVNLCKLPFKYSTYTGRYKYPKLVELAEHLELVWDEEKAHTALYDVMITWTCFLHVCERLELTSTYFNS